MASDERDESWGDWRAWEPWKAHHATLSEDGKQRASLADFEAGMKAGWNAALAAAPDDELEAAVDVIARMLARDAGRAGSMSDDVHARARDMIAAVLARRKEADRG
jgi:hypothetical protein